MLARDVMTTEVISVVRDTDVSEIAKLLTRARISAVPVIDPDGKLLGIVSEGDLLRRAETGTEKKRGSWWLSLLTSPDQLAREYAKSHGRRAADVMTKDVFTVSDDTPVAEIARILEEKHVKRVPVLREGRIVGIVSRANLVQGLATASTAAAAPARAASDAEIRDRIMAELREQDWAQVSYANVTVEGGVAHLWGMAETKAQIEAFEIVAQQTPGIKSVENHLNLIDRHFYYGE